MVELDYMAAYMYVHNRVRSRGGGGGPGGQNPPPPPFWGIPKFHKGKKRCVCAHGNATF